MTDEEKTRGRVEIAHVLFIDIVGYSKLLIDEQSGSLHELNGIVRQTAAVQAAEAAGRLIRLPTGDGMALVFTSTVEAPVECALEISQALRAKPSPPLRMGIHSGPVQHVEDVNQRANFAGAGINIAQRVMDCGDAGHILVSKRVADDLAGSRHWQRYLHELGDCEVKHGVVVSLVNLYADVVGNPAPPARLGRAKAARRRLVPFGAARRSPVRRWLPGAAAVLLAAALAGALWQWEAAGRRAAPAGAVPEKSIAVLPFENLSADQDNAFFTDGVQDEILTDLAKVADLKVISRTSVMQYKDLDKRNLREIGRQLGVAHLLEGSVQRADGKVRVTAQLIDARTDAHTWAEHYDRPLDDVFAIQSEVARAIAGQLQAHLSPREKSAIAEPPTADFQAFDLYLHAQTLFGVSTASANAQKNNAEAVRLLEEALARDPKFLLAWCLLARVHCTFYFAGLDHTPVRLAQAHAAVQRALALQPDSGEAHLALADYYYHGFRDYDHALAAMDVARRTLPNSAEVYEYSGYIDRRQGRWGEATRNLEHALELDPRNFFLHQQMAITYLDQHRYDDEARLLDRALAIVPNDPYTHILRAIVDLDARADTRPFQAALAALLKEDPSLGPDVDDPSAALCERTPEAAARSLAHYPSEGAANNGVVTPHAFWEGVVARWEGDGPRARAAFASARADVEKVVAAQPNLAVAISLLGVIDAGLGRKADAIAEGRRACELLPISRDGIDGPVIADNLAQIYAWSGEKKAAVEQLRLIERTPNTDTYGYLKLHPIYDDLRGDPAFEALVASLAPK